jgi:hypothetical protein
MRLTDLNSKYNFYLTNKWDLDFIELRLHFWYCLTDQVERKQIYSLSAKITDDDLQSEVVGIIDASIDYFP